MIRQPVSQGCGGNALLPQWLLPSLFTLCFRFVLEIAKTENGTYTFSMAFGIAKPVIFLLNFIVFHVNFKIAPGDLCSRVPVPILTPLVVFNAIFDFRDLQKGTLSTTFFARRARKS